MTQFMIDEFFNITNAIEVDADCESTNYPYVDGLWIGDKYPVGDDVLRTAYETLTVSLIRERYSVDDESKILREFMAYGAEKQEVFALYNTFVENCKKISHDKIYGEEVI